MAQSKRASDATLSELHDRLAKVILRHIADAEKAHCDACGRDGGVDPRVLAAGIKLLKDNGIVAVATPKSPLGALADKLPFLSAEERASLVGGEEE